MFMGIQTYMSREEKIALNMYTLGGVVALRKAGMRKKEKKKV